MYSASKFIISAQSSSKDGKVDCGMFMYENPYERSRKLLLELGIVEFNMEASMSKKSGSNSIETAFLV